MLISPHWLEKEKRELDESQAHSFCRVAAVLSPSLQGNNCPCDVCTESNARVAHAVPFGLSGLQCGGLCPGPSFLCSPAMPLVNFFLLLLPSSWWALVTLRLQCKLGQWNFLIVLTPAVNEVTPKIYCIYCFLFSFFVSSYLSTQTVLEISAIEVSAFSHIQWNSIVQSDLQHTCSFTQSHGRGCHLRCQLLIRGNLGLLAQGHFNIFNFNWGSQGFEPRTFWKLDDPLYLLRYSRSDYLIQRINKVITFLQRLILVTEHDVNINGFVANKIFSWARWVQIFIHILFKINSLNQSSEFNDY